MRRAFGSALPAFGLPAIAAPVSGFEAQDRAVEPGRVAGVRTSWLRSAPPSAVGGVRVPPRRAGGSPHGLTGAPSWP